jgi:transposase-like protein
VVAAQEASGQNVRQFCGKRGIGEHSFYWWRKRLRDSGPVQFALIGTAPARAACEASALELVLSNGERLRIGKEVDPATLRLVLEAVRG